MSSWSIVLDLGRDSTGKRRQKWHTIHGTKRDAQRELSRLLNSVHTGTYVEPAKLTVKEYLEQWLENYAESNVAHKTFERYKEIIRLHLSPALGHHPLSKLTPLHIQGYYSQALKAGRRDRTGGLAAQTVLHHHRILREALHQAVRWQLLVRNPADAVDPPRPERRSLAIPDEDSIRRLIRSIDETWLQTPVIIAIATGMRRGEILALRWQDVDLKSGRLKVCQSLEQTRSGLNFKEPKTSSSRRLVAIPAFAVEALRRHKLVQAKLKLRLGPAYVSHDLVCAKPDGTPYSPSYLTNCFINLVAELDLPRFRFHDLRHAHATQLLQQNIHPKVVSERLGHSRVGFTLDVYSHVLPSLQEEAARSIDSAFRSTMRKAR